MPPAEPHADTHAKAEAAPPSDAGDLSLLCPQCGYDLRHMASPRCPECGLKIDRDALKQSQIPWVHRKKLRRFAGFWKTAWLVSFRPRRLRWEMSQPVDLREALRFRRQVVLLVWIACMALTLAGQVLFPREMPELSRVFRELEMDFLPWSAVAWSLPVLLLLWLIGVTGVHTYWFHPRSMPRKAQDRAVALSYYACAPLAWAAVSVLGAIICLVLLWLAEEVFDNAVTQFTHLVLLRTGQIGMGFFALLAALAIAGTAGVCRLLINWLTDRGGFGKTVFILTLPVLWLLLGLLLFGVVPVVGLYIWLIIATLRGAI